MSKNLQSQRKPKRRKYPPRMEVDRRCLEEDWRGLSKIYWKGRVVILKKDEGWQENWLSSLEHAEYALITLFARSSTSSHHPQVSECHVHTNSCILVV